MSVTEFKEIDNGRDGEKTLKTDGSSVTRYTRVFRARTDDNYDDATVVSSHASCPRVGEQYPYDIQAYCRSVRARNETAKRIWIITCGYSTERELRENPLDDPAEIEWATEQFQKPVEKDRNGKAPVNSAGEWYDPPIMRDDSRVTATISKNLATVPSWILTYRDAVNDAAFELDGISIAKGRAKIQSIRVSAWQERNDIEYRVVTIVMHFAEPRDGKEVGKEWHIFVPDHSFTEKDPNDATQRRNIRNDGDNELPTGPVMLDGDGNRLENPNFENTKYNEFDVYEEKNFSVLPLT